MAEFNEFKPTEKNVSLAESKPFGYILVTLISAFIFLLVMSQFKKCPDISEQNRTIIELVNKNQVLNEKNHYKDSIIDNMPRRIDSIVNTIIKGK